MENKCRYCGESFNSSDKRRRFCSSKCAYLGRKNSWTQEEKTFLRENYKLFNKKLSELLHKTISSIEGEKHKLKLRWANKRIAICCSYCGKQFLPASRNTRFCSLSCRDKARDKTQPLGFCHPVHSILSPSPELSYILGVLKGDGYCYHFQNKKKSDSIIALSVNDYEFAQSFAKALCSIGLNPHTFSLEKYKNQTTKWRTTCSSREFVSWYKDLSTEDIFTMLKMEQRFILEFFRGFYEAEGWLGKVPTKSYYFIGVSNTDKILLQKIQEEMGRLGYDFRLSKGIKPKPAMINGIMANFTKIVYTLVLHKKAQVIKLLTEIQPAIPRKRW